MERLFILYCLIDLLYFVIILKIRLAIWTVIEKGGAAYFYNGGSFVKFTLV